MTSLITLWPSDSLESIMSAVQQIIESDFNADAHYASDSGANPVAAIESAYRNLIRLTDIDPTLHVLTIVPLGCRNVYPKVKDIAETCRDTNHRVSLHVIGLGASLWKLYGAASEAEAKAESEKNLAAIQQIALDSRISFPVTLIEDYVSSGAPANFTDETLARWLATLFLGLLTDYYRIFPVAYMTDGPEKNITVGLSGISFDKARAADYLMHRAFVASLEQAGILQTNVDIQRASTRAAEQLAGSEQRFSTFVEKKVIPEFRKGKKESDEIVAETAPALDNEIAGIAARIKDVLREPDTSFPEKESILAMILGRDNKLLRGVQYDTERPLIDDAVTDAITPYIDAYNNCCSGTGLIPVRGDFDALKYKNIEINVAGSSVEITESKENQLAFNPIPELKTLKKKILDETSFIRRKNDELQQLADANKERDMQEEGVSDKGFRNRPIFEEFKEKPLENMYRPAAGLKPMPSVDLRKFFSPVKDQGQVGACSSFATIAMYEMIMNQHAPAGSVPADMSERFLFYHTNVLQGRPEGGSNYHDQLNVLANSGICTEALCPSDNPADATPPTAEATHDALKHRVLQALQLPLAEGDGQETALDANHRLITSALTEGYPVGIALKIYPSFGNTTYINRPSAKETEDEEAGYHAMVLAGYSETDKCYIVRNSWGNEFGDDGYCYISSAYIDDPEFNRFACIITQTTDSAEAKGAEVPQVVAGFGGTEMQIRMAVIRNELDYASVRLNNKKKIYNETYRYYQTLLNRLCVPSVRETISRKAEDAAKDAYEDLCSEYDALQNDFPKKLKEYRKEYIKTALSVSGVAMLADVLAVPQLFMGHYSMWFWIAYCVAGILTTIAVLLWVNYALNMRRKRLELQDELDHCGSQRFAAKRKWQELRLRFHLAGMWIDRFNQLHIEITRLYDRLVNYVDNLRQWHREDTDCIAKSLPSRGSMTITLEDAHTLSDFFTENSHRILAKLDLMEAFGAYAIDSKTISSVREKLGDETRQAIITMFSDFRMIDYLLGKASYPYVLPRKLDDAISMLIMTGQPTWRYSGIESDESAYAMMLHYDDREMDSWRKKTTSFFSSNPSLIDIDNPEVLYLFTVKQTPMP